MISVMINGEQQQLSPDVPLSEAIHNWGYSGQQFAIAINDNFVARNSYPSTRLHDGDRIEVIAPMQGG